MGIRFTTVYIDGYEFFICSSACNPVIQQISCVMLDIYDLVKIRLKVVLIAAGIAIYAGEFTPIIWINAVATPEPTVYEFVLVENCFECS